MDAETMLQYGALGAMVLVMLPTFIWWVRSARADVREATAVARADVKESLGQYREVTDAFLAYVKDTASNQTEAMLTVSNSLERMGRRMEEGFDGIGRRMDRIEERVG